LRDREPAIAPQVGARRRLRGCDGPRLRTSGSGG